LVWSEFRVAGRVTTNVLFAKALQVYGVIRGRRDAQALVLSASCDRDCGQARDWLSRYAMAAAEQWYEAAESSVKPR
jgi:hypothetical protein